MSSAIRADWPGRAGIVVDLKQHSSHAIAQPDGSGAIRETVGIRAGHRRDAIDGLEVGRVLRDDQERSALEDCAGRKSESDIPIDLEAAQVREKGLRVE